MTKTGFLLPMFHILFVLSSVHGFSPYANSPLGPVSLLTHSPKSRVIKPGSTNIQKHPFSVRGRLETEPSSTTELGLFNFFKNNLENDDKTTTSAEIDFSKLKPQVYDQRWIQLGYLSVLALVSDWICFSVAAAPATYETAYAGHSAAQLIDIFLFTNVASCFLVTDTVRKFGLETAIKGASALMAVGCLFRSGIGFVGPLLASVGLGDVAAATDASAGLVPYWSIIAGTIMVGASQPFFQCTPPLLSATWFASDERATSTAIALNFNQIGIATAFLVGGEMATSTEGLANYFGLITAICLATTIGTFLQFENKPPTPPST